MDSKTKVLGTGLSGMVGSRIVELLEPQGFEFENLSLETGVDITDPETVRRAFDSSDAAWAFHFAAFTDVDRAEKERERGEESVSWKVNVTATEYIAAAAKKHNKRLLYISTDFVFDGKQEAYTEDDAPLPLSWYGITKYEGEKRVEANDDSLIVRIAFPYLSHSGVKKDFVHRIRDALQSGKEVQTPNDQIITPTYVDDIAHALQTLMKNEATGIVHVVGSSSPTPFDCARMIADVFEIKNFKIRPVKFASYFDGRAPRPFHAQLVNAKIKKLGIEMKTLQDGLREVVQSEREDMNI